MSFTIMLIGACFVAGLSQIGILSVFFKPKFLKKILLTLVAFSVGSLIGDAFIHLLPEAFEKNPENPLFISIAIFTGLILFFLLEKILRWRHCHDTDCHEHENHFGMINLFGDGMHNVIDGILIGVSFSVSLALGITTLLAIIFHEIPHELGNFGVLLRSGFKIKKALLYNFYSSIPVVLSAIVAYFIGQRASGFVDFMIPLTIGSFLYIALCDLIPELHKETSFKHTVLHLAGMFLGIGSMFLLLLID